MMLVSDMGVRSVVYSDGVDQAPQNEVEAKTSWWRTRANFVFQNDK